MKKQLIFGVCLMGLMWQGVRVYAQPWNLSGNIVSPTGTNFIGTLNPEPLRFRVGGMWAGSLDDCGTTFLGVDAGNVNSDCSNTGFGYGVLTTVNTAGVDNTGLGREALHSNSSGSFNTGLGTYALMSNDTGSWNTAVGAYSLTANTFGIGNTALGIASLWTNSIGSFNTAIGAFALALSIGDKNTALGWGSMGYNATGYENVAVGCSTLYSNTTGSYNVVNGTNAMRFNTSGEGNTGVGWSVLENNSTGKYNTAFGFGSLNKNTTGYSNTAIGIRALYNNTTRGNLIAIGDSALYNNGVGATGVNDGTKNTAVGSKAMFSNTTGFQNVAFGTEALYSNTLGSANTAIGLWTLRANTTGTYNTATGRSVLANNTTGANNLGTGFGALYLNTTGNGNTATGYQALRENTTGSNNSALGCNAGVSSGALTNATALGNGAIVNASNKTRIGNAAMTVVETQTNYFIPSDARFKTNVSEDVKGLEFISKLRPVVYNFDTKKFTEFLTQGMADSVKKDYLEGVDFEPSTTIRQSGFLAQEVEVAAIESGYDFNGLHKPTHDNDNYSIAYGQFVVPLVKATQELNDQNKAQQEMIQNLQSQVDALKAMVQAGCNTSSDKGLGQLPALKRNRLDQNTPNPFDGKTVIRYSVVEALPDTYLQIVSLEGVQVAYYPITVKGEGQITVDADRLPDGVYLYQLIVKGELFASHKMVVMR